MNNLCKLCSDISSSPAHDTGLVTLQVAVSNQIISNSVVFEYKARALPSLPSSQHDWLSLDGMSLLCFTVAMISFPLTFCLFLFYFYFTHSVIYLILDLFNSLLSLLIFDIPLSNSTKFSFTLN